MAATGRHRTRPDDPWYHSWLDESEESELMNRLGVRERSQIPDREDLPPDIQEWLGSRPPRSWPGYRGNTPGSGGSNMPRLRDDIPYEDLLRLLDETYGEGGRPGREGMILRGPAGGMSVRLPFERLYDEYLVPMGMPPRVDPNAVPEAPRPPSVDPEMTPAEQEREERIQFYVDMMTPPGIDRSLGGADLPGRIQRERDQRTRDPGVNAPLDEMPDPGWGTLVSGIFGDALTGRFLDPTGQPGAISQYAQELGRNFVSEISSIVQDPSSLVGPGNLTGSFVGRQGARKLADILDQGEIFGQRITTTSAEALRIPERAFNMIDDLERAGKPDSEIIATVNRMIADSPGELPYMGRISDLIGGVRRGVDGIWRLEVSDRQMDLTQEVLRTLFNPSGSRRRVGERELSGTLEDIVAHPVLFSMFPELRGMRTIIASSRPGQEEGIIFPTIINGVSQNQLMVSAPNAATARRIISHELQHYIQGVEGFASGGTQRSRFGMVDAVMYGDGPENAALRDMYMNSSVIGLISRGDLTRARAAIDGMPEWQRRGSIEEVITTQARSHFGSNFAAASGVERFEGRTLEQLAQYFERYPHLRNIHSVSAIGNNVDYELYLRLAGEVESRMVEGRSLMAGPALRRMTVEDTPGHIPESRQIVPPGNKPDSPGVIQESIVPFPTRPIAEVRRSIGELSERMDNLISRGATEDIATPGTEALQAFNQMLREISAGAREGRFTRQEAVELIGRLSEFQDRLDTLRTLVPVPGSQRAVERGGPSGRQGTPQPARERLGTTEDRYYAGVGRARTLNQELLGRITDQTPAPTRYLEDSGLTVRYGPETIGRMHQFILSEITGSRMVSEFNNQILQNMSNRLKAETGVRLTPQRLRQYIIAMTLPQS